MDESVLAVLAPYQNNLVSSENDVVTIKWFNVYASKVGKSQLLQLTFLTDN